MITLREETVTCIPNIYVVKRDGRRVNFDVDKIYKALVKAARRDDGRVGVLQRLPLQGAGGE